MRSSSVRIALFVVFFGLSFVPESIALELPIEFDNVLLNSGDLPMTIEKTTISTINDPIGAGWLTDSNLGNDVPIQGVRQNFFCADTILGFKIGYFPTAQQAKESAQTAILSENTLYITNFHPGNYSEKTFGDNCYHWDLSLEPAGIRQSLSPDFFQRILAFSKGRYAILIDIFSKTKPIDQSQMDLIASRFEAKVSIAIAAENFDSSLETLISHNGIRQSLQAKLNSFSDNYMKGQYKTAMNNIKAFVRELDAQRGKHVGEAAYQTMKGYSDSVLQALSALF